MLSLGQVEAASNALWAFLILCLTGDATYAVDNAGPREGFEVWRRLFKGIRSRCEIRRHELLGKIQRPEEARSLQDVPASIDKWEAMLPEYGECGGRWMPFEDTRSALLQILPDELRRDMFMRLSEMQNSLVRDASPEHRMCTSID